MYTSGVCVFVYFAVGTALDAAGRALSAPLSSFGGAAATDDVSACLQPEPACLLPFRLSRPSVRFAGALHEMQCNEYIANERRECLAKCEAEGSPAESALLINVQQDVHERNRSVRGLHENLRARLNSCQYDVIKRPSNGSSDAYNYCIKNAAFERFFTCQSDQVRGQTVPANRSHDIDRSLLVGQMCFAVLFNRVRLYEGHCTTASSSCPMTSHMSSGSSHPCRVEQVGDLTAHDQLRYFTAYMQNLSHSINELLDTSGQITSCSACSNVIDKVKCIHAKYWESRVDALVDTLSLLETYQCFLDFIGSYLRKRDHVQHIY